MIEGYLVDVMREGEGESEAVIEEKREQVLVVLGEALEGGADVDEQIPGDEGQAARMIAAMIATGTSPWTLRHAGGELRAEGMDRPVPVESLLTVLVCSRIETRVREVERRQSDGGE